MGEKGCPELRDKVNLWDIGFNVKAATDGTFVVTEDTPERGSMTRTWGFSSATHLLKWLSEEVRPIGLFDGSTREVE